jgi:uncharacterized protein (UPF0335 family)
MSANSKFSVCCSPLRRPLVAFAVEQVAEPCPRHGAQGDPHLNAAKDNQASERREVPPSIRGPSQSARLGAALTLAWHRASIAGPRAERRLGRVPIWLLAVEQFGGGVFIQFSSSRTLYDSINFSVTFIAIAYALSKKGARMTNTAGIPGDRICSFIERVEHIDEEIKALNEGKKEVFAEAKGEGFDVKVLREILRLRKQDKDERDEQESLLDLYLRAMESAGSSQAEAA